MHEVAGYPCYRRALGCEWGGGRYRRASCRISFPPFATDASIKHGPKVPPFLAEPGQTPHITMWHYGCERLFRCCCAGSMRREGYDRCAGAVVLGYGRSAPLNTAVECSSSPQHWGSKATGRAPCGPGSGKTEISCRHRGSCSSHGWLAEAALRSVGLAVWELY